jgi:hypothetical protein
MYKTWYVSVIGGLIILGSIYGWALEPATAPEEDQPAVASDEPEPESEPDAGEPESEPEPEPAGTA